jgi:hypothetical protein
VSAIPQNHALDVCRLTPQPVRSRICPASQYVLSAGTAPGLSNVAIVNLGAALSLSASAPPGVYYVRVVAQNAFGSSGPSNEVIVRVGAGSAPSGSPSS